MATTTDRPPTSNDASGSAFTACLFMGGPLDGHLIPIENHKNTYRVQQMLSREVRGGAVDDTTTQKTGAYEFQNVEYHREVLEERGKTYFLFTCLPENATRLGRLLLGYRGVSL